MWLEILSRMPIDSLLVCKCVCRSWRDIGNYLMDSQSVPLCGILLRFGSNNIPEYGTYICMQTKKSILMQNHEFTVHNGYKKSLLDFSALGDGNFNNPDPERRGCFYAMHQGLLLLSFYRGIYEVRNPITKEVFVVPGKKRCSDGMMTPGMIIRLPTPPGCKCDFMVIRLCCYNWNSIEVYRSKTGVWERSPLELNNEFLNNHNISLSTVNNYVALVDGSDSYLFLLANICGVVLKFRDQKSPERVDDQYTFPLPQLVRERLRNTRLWDCGGILHISGNDSNGTWIWKHPDDYASSTKADTWAWIPLRKINNTDFVVEPSLGINNHTTVWPLACHPDVAVVYFLVQSSVFAYDLTIDILEKITDIHNPLENVSKVVGFPFKPCLSLLNVAKITDIDSDHLNVGGIDNHHMNIGGIDNHHMNIGNINNLGGLSSFLSSALPILLLVLAFALVFFSRSD